MNANPRHTSSWRGIEGWAGLVPLLTLVIFPIAWTFGYSLAYGLGGIGLLSDGWTLRHWHSALEVGGLGSSLLFSLAVGSTVTVLATTGSLALVLGMPQARNRAMILLLICVPLATPSAVAAVITYQLLNPGGFLARLAFHAGLIESPSSFPALVNDPYAIGIVIAQTASAWALLSLFFLMTWEAARAERYCRLAESLGATVWVARWKVALPMLCRRGRAMILLVFLLNLGSYEIPLLLGRQAPQMFSVLTQRRFGQFDLFQRPEAFVLATSYFLIVGLGLQLYLLARRVHV